MAKTITPRTIRETTSRDALDLLRRRMLCADFKRRLKALKLTVREFARLAAVPVATAYSWTARSAACVPPPPYALRFLRLIEKDWNVVSLLDEIAAEG